MTTTNLSSDLAMLYSLIFKRSLQAVEQLLKVISTSLFELYLVNCKYFYSTELDPFSS